MICESLQKLRLLNATSREVAYVLNHYVIRQQCCDSSIITVYKSAARSNKVKIFIWDALFSHAYLIKDKGLHDTALKEHCNANANQDMRINRLAKVIAKMALWVGEHISLVASMFQMSAAISVIFLWRQKANRHAQHQFLRIF